ncbi:hypothetical protein JB92DRAFT_2828764 [Gautieria morchelliformis]|nr:hypothetical protein JB92DRAFT_2828764 [Gautieria morchelliformis]
MTRGTVKPHVERHGAISDPLDNGVVKTIASERQKENRRAIGGKERKENAGQDDGTDRQEKRQGEGKKKENACQDDGTGRHRVGFSCLQTGPLHVTPHYAHEDTASAGGKPRKRQKKMKEKKGA